MQLGRKGTDLYFRWLSTVTTASGACAESRMPESLMRAGLRVLVVDDEWLSAYEVERLVHKLDCVVMGPAASVNGAPISLRMTF